MALTTEENIRLHELLNKYKQYSYLDRAETTELQYLLKKVEQKDMDKETTDAILLLALFGLGALVGAAMASGGKKAKV